MYFKFYKECYIFVYTIFCRIRRKNGEKQSLTLSLRYIVAPEVAERGLSFFQAIRSKPPFMQTCLDE